MKRTCSVCKWFEIDTNDPLVESIKKRHAERHLRHGKQYQGGGNNIYGVVEWV